MLKILCDRNNGTKISEHITNWWSFYIIWFWKEAWACSIDGVRHEYVLSNADEVLPNAEDARIFRGYGAENKTELKDDRPSIPERRDDDADINSDEGTDSFDWI